MSDFIKKSMLMGIGLVSLTREKAEAFIDDLIKRGELSEKEGREAVDELVQRSKEVKSDVSRKVEKMVSDTLKRMNIPSRAEIDEIKMRIAELEKKTADEE
ncbi:MAG: phasin family protein [Syntrophales bacterium]|jgi:poly(hydroxyalkanoate) granule-associated protein|nr:phasin family protein [Syntrophales bacterium]MDY0044046.1 phasin family protein [Syntrophales bacterium]